MSSSQIIAGIDAIIRNLGDNAPALTCRQHNRKRCRHNLLQSQVSNDSTADEGSFQFAPLGLEQEFKELYQLLEKGLIDKTNVSALLMGSRGEGKSLVLDRCLMALQHHSKKIEQVGFRVVRLNGILLKGQNVSIVVSEIVNQLCEIVSKEKSKLNKDRFLRNDAQQHKRQKMNDGDIDELSTCTNDGQDQNGEWIEVVDDSLKQKLHALGQKQAHMFRTRTSTFSSSMACLDEAFELSSIDSVPILIVLDELDSFLPKARSTEASSTSSAIVKNDSNYSTTSSASRDLLLYHLLDRIAGKGSLISMVGLCARLTTISSYEKRVKSRAQGTSKIVHFSVGKGHEEQNDCCETLVNIIMSNFDICTHGLDNDSNIFLQELYNIVKEILLPKIDNDQNSSSEKEAALDRKNRIQKLFQVQRDLGQSIRWFCRVISVSLGLYVEDITDSVDTTKKMIKFDESYIIEGLSVMDADMFLSDDIARVTMDNDESDDEDNVEELSTISPRVNDLIQLSGAQVAVLLSSKRILKRDAQSMQNETSSMKNMARPLTYERIRREYDTSFLQQNKSSGPDRYDEVAFFKSFLDLLGVMFFPSKDHTGKGPNQYYFSKKYSRGGIWHEMLKKTPVHLNLHIDDDLLRCLDANLLKCSSALKEWARTAG